MKMKFALLADYVNQTQEGKLNIIGEFDVLFAPRVPATHTTMFLVVRFEASVSEGTDHTLNIGLYNADGHAVLPKTPGLKLPFQAQGPGLPLRGQVIAQLGGMKFPEFGRYEFHLLVNGRNEGVVPLTVVELAKRKKGGKS